MLHRITPTETERIAHTFNAETIKHATHCLRTDGALILEAIVDERLVQEAREAFLERYARYLSGDEHDDALQVGGKRIMVTIDFDSPFDNSVLYENSWLLPVLRAAFQDDFILGGYGVVCSLPGAPGQHRHRDGGILFPQSGLDRLLPMAAVTVIVPLLEMNSMHGMTALWPGSHRNSDHLVAPILNGKAEKPAVKEGSCLLWDYRLVHGGTPNRGALPRPLLYMSYCRPWFLDYLNYEKQPLLRVSKNWVSGLSRDSRKLFARATAHWLPNT